MLSTVGAFIGPLVGGAIGTTSTWIWVFFLKSSTSPASVPWQPLLKRVDFVGAFLLLSASVLVITALLEVSTVFTWSSAATLIR
ncbi:hypothetical protein BofuT4_uP083610.1 [Botrytis cinerea T4]|uniref:Major facilitator superfamily (MFS) profile domain-containing protein n=1 Tax=Botryotinia fuckeliana (strain T4) TaxID=999810 RepID=G2YK10_BOTF4|nr:hypothetical protein BofuT4_uP083610.1 [Botrytis cinerea T4]